MAKQTGNAITQAEFKQLREGDLYWITDENDMREFSHFTKKTAKGEEFKAVNSDGMVNRLEHMRWPTKSEVRAWSGDDVEDVKQDSKSYSKVEETEVSCKVSTKKEEVKMGMLAKDGFVNQALTTVKDDSVDALWRVAAKQSIQNAKLPLTAFLSKQKLPTSALAIVGAALDTQNGEAALALLLGHSMRYVPAFASNPKLSRLARELRVLGTDTFLSQVADAVLTPLRSAFVEVVSQLPFGGDAE